MARYQTDFEGFPAAFGSPAGLDPNYRDGYRGMRMRGDGRQASYGAHRLARREDLETLGGFQGIYGGPTTARERRLQSGD